MKIFLSPKGLFSFLIVSSLKLTLIGRLEWVTINFNRNQLYVVRSERCSREGWIIIFLKTFKIVKIFYNLHCHLYFDVKMMTHTFLLSYILTNCVQRKAKQWWRIGAAARHILYEANRKKYKKRKSTDNNKQIWLFIYSS